ncbi:MAG TPA: glycosyltransferase family 8 protein [Xanthobacteraceae bacterium]|jgi:lipopolysaccharide biosynthesis glycosyltransferase
MAEVAGSGGTVHVACCFDQQMELPFLVLAGSLKRHLKGSRRVVLHAFHSDPIAHDLAYFVGFNSATFELRLREIENRFHGVAIWPGHLTAGTLLRLQLPSVLKDIDRVVYLDCDLVVLKDISTLYDTDLLDLPLAACLDFWLTGAPPFAPPIVGWGIGEWHKFLSEVVRLADCRAYFNSGVLVMDLKRFRNSGLIHAAEEFLERTNYKTVFVDQDALNHVINGAFVRLDSRWNVLGNRGETDFKNADCEFAALAALTHSDPWIIHYAGPHKPWSCEGRRMIIWNRRFWQEAVESAVLPLLVRAYLETCDRRGLTKLQSASVLLSCGKPRLCKRDIVAHAERFRGFTEAAQASESIARGLDRRLESADAAAALVSVDGLSHRGGVRDGETLIFDLKAADGQIVFGPYLWCPPGSYEATFNLAVTHVAPDPTNKLAIDIVDNADRYLAQQDLSPIPSTSESRLQFVVDRSEVFLAFRVFATGFPGGKLRFGGVKLRPQGPH